MFGESFSGYDSLRFAAFDQRIAAHGLRILGAETLEDFANNPRFAYDLEGVLHRIECPLLVVHCTEEALVQPNPLKQALTNFEQAGSQQQDVFSR